MSMHYGQDFGPSKAVADARLVRDLTVLARRRTGHTGASYWLPKLLTAGMGRLSLGLALALLAVVPGVLVVRPLTPAFDVQVAAPSVFGFLALSFLLMSILCPGPFGHEGGVAGSALANTPAPARLVYLLPLRRARRSAGTILWVCSLPCLWVAWELVKLSDAGSSSWWRLPGGAALLWMLMFLPAAVRRWRRGRPAKKRAVPPVGGRPSSGCAFACGWLSLMVACVFTSVAGDQIAIWLHAFNPRLVPLPEQVGDALRWLPHAGILEWLNGGPYPWLATVAALGCGAWTAHSMWDSLRDRHMDQGLDEEGAPRPAEGSLGVTTLQLWMDAARDKPVPKGVDDDTVETSPGTKDLAFAREAALGRLRSLIAAQGEGHPAQAWLKHEAEWKAATQYGLLPALYWSLCATAALFVNLWLTTQTVLKAPLALWSLGALTFIGCFALGIWLIALLAGWQFHFKLPKDYDRVPVDIQPALAVFRDYDRRQFYLRLRWMLYPLLCVALLAGLMRILVSDLPLVQMVMPYALSGLGLFAAAMVGLTALMRATDVAVVHELSRRPSKSPKVQSLATTSGLCHVGSAVLVAVGTLSGWWWCWPGVALAMWCGEKARAACFRERVQEVLFGRLDRMGRGN